MKDLRVASTGQLLLAPAACAGLPLALLGLVESLYVAPGHLSVQWYAVGLYGLAGLAAGLLFGLLFGGRARRRDFGLIRLCGQAAAWPTFGLAAAVAGFLVWRDLWSESFSQAGVGGWLAMLGVPVGAALLAVIAREISRVLVFNANRWALIVFFVCLPGLLLGRVLEGSGVDVPGPSEAEGSDGRAPVVLVVADAMRADALGAYGADAGASPNLDAFAKDAVVFDQAWTAATWTRPAVATLLTGQYPRVHKTMHKSDRLPEGLSTLAGMLVGRGYATVASVTNVNLAPAFGLGRGFEAWGYLPPRPHLMAPVAGQRLFLVEVYRLLRLRFLPGNRQVSSYYAEGERVSALGKELIAPQVEAGRPFFAYLHYMETHDPFFAHPYDGHAIARVEQPNPPASLAPEMHALYAQEVRHFDGLFGELVAWLKAKGIYDRALIVFTSDHGEEFGDHGGFWHGTSLYQELVRVPLMVRFPGGQGAGTRRHEPVSLIDVAPTALAAAGLPPSKDLPGQALTAIAPAAPVAPAAPAAPAEPADPDEPGDPAEPTPAKEPGEAAAAAAAPVAAPLRSLFAALDHQGCRLHAIRLGALKLIRANPDNPRGLAETELYDLKADPDERTNLAPSLADQVERLGKLLEAGPQGGGTAAALTPGQVDVDAATEEQLRALGYTQ